MTALYLDTSCLPPFFTTETASARARKFFALEAPAAPFCISHWTMAEFHSAIAQKVRMGLLTPALQSEVLSAFESLARAHFDCWPLLAADFLDAAALCDSAKLNLRAGDALHLAIARRQKAVLVSLDTNLLKAAKAFKIATRTF